MRVGGTVAALGVLLSLIAGVSRTTFAMAADGDLPGGSAPSTPSTACPTTPSSPSGAIVVAVVAVADLRGAIGFSSFAVLTYYAIANASAWTLPPAQRRGPRALAVAGVVGCVGLAVSLPPASVVAGLGVLSAGTAVWLVGTTRRGSR